MLNKFLGWFAGCWIGLVLLVNVVVIAYTFIVATSLWRGWEAFTNIYSPYTPSTYIINIILCSPALAAMFWKRKREGVA